MHQARTGCWFQSCCSRNLYSQTYSCICHSKLFMSGINSLWPPHTRHMQSFAHRVANWVQPGGSSDPNSTDLVCARLLSRAFRLRGTRTKFACNLNQGRPRHDFGLEVWRGRSVIVKSHYASDFNLIMPANAARPVPSRSSVGGSGITGGVDPGVGQMSLDVIPKFLPLAST